MPNCWRELAIFRRFPGWGGVCGVSGGFIRLLPALEKKRQLLLSLHERGFNRQEASVAWWLGR